MGNEAFTACLPSHVAHAVGLPTQEELINEKFEKAKIKLSEGVHLLDQRLHFIDQRHERVEEEIRRKAKTDRAGALTAMKYMKGLEKARDKASEAKTNLEDHLTALNENQFNGELHTVLEECNKVMLLKNKKLTVSHVENTIDSLIETHRDTKEISDILSRPVNEDDEELDAHYGGSGDADGGDLFLKNPKLAAEKRLEQELDALLEKDPPKGKEPELDEPMTKSPPSRYSPVDSRTPLDGAVTRVLPFPSVPLRDPMETSQRSSVRGGRALGSRGSLRQPPTVPGTLGIRRMADEFGGTRVLSARHSMSMMQPHSVYQQANVPGSSNAFLPSHGFRQPRITTPMFM